MKEAGSPITLGEDFLTKAQLTMREHAASRSLQPHTEQAERNRLIILIAFLIAFAIGDGGIAVMQWLHLPLLALRIASALTLLSAIGCLIVISISILDGRKRSDNDRWNPVDDWVSIDRLANRTDIKFIRALEDCSDDELAVLVVWLRILQAEYRSRFRTLYLASIPATLILASGTLGGSPMSQLLASITSIAKPTAAFPRPVLDPLLLRSRRLCGIDGDCRLPAATARGARRAAIACEIRHRPKGEGNAKATRGCREIAQRQRIR